MPKHEYEGEVSHADLQRAEHLRDAKPCPFCGSKDLEFSADVYAVCCRGCQASGPDIQDEIEAIGFARWNEQASKT
jgi:hypothetical protein